jgi:hypothetical protein
MRRRWVVTGLVVLALVAVLAGALRPRGLTVADADRVRIRMTEAEVAALFGETAVNGWVMSDDPGSREGLPPLAARPDRLARWESESAIIVVYFADDRAVGTAAARQGPESLWSKLARWATLDF